MNFSGVKVIDVKGVEYNKVIYNLIEQGGYLCSYEEQE